MIKFIIKFFVTFSKKYNNIPAYFEFRGCTHTSNDIITSCFFCSCGFCDIGF